jgi:hypothetical protein
MSKPKDLATPNELWASFRQKMDIPDSPGTRLLFFSGFAAGMGFILKKGAFAQTAAWNEIDARFRADERPPQESQD